MKSRSSVAAFGSGLAVGTLGGLIGLGGAEFRLPILIGFYGFGALPAVILNKALSLVVVASSLPFRAGTVPLSSVLDRWEPGRPSRSEPCSRIQLGYNAETKAVGIRSAPEEGKGRYLLRAQKNSASRLIDGKRFFAHQGVKLEKVRRYDVEEFGGGIIGFHMTEASESGRRPSRRRRPSLTPPRRPRPTPPRRPCPTSPRPTYPRRPRRPPSPPGVDAVPVPPPEADPAPLEAATRITSHHESKT